MASLLSEEPLASSVARAAGVFLRLAADVVVWDPNYRNIITNGNHLHACDRLRMPACGVRPAARRSTSGRLVAECGELLLRERGGFSRQAERPSL
jgi:hypothetical protein